MSVILLILISSLLVTVQGDCDGENDHTYHVYLHRWYNNTCHLFTVQVSKQQNITFKATNLFFAYRIKVTHNFGSPLFMGKLGSISLATSNSNHYKIINQSEEQFTFKIVNVTKLDAGIYQWLDSQRYTLGCVALFVSDKPVTVISNQHQPVLRRIEDNCEFKGEISLTCNATSTTLLTSESLPLRYRWINNDRFPMTYRWFKHGICYGNGNILQDIDVNITDIGHDIICIATDDPCCTAALQDLKQDATLTTVTTNTECERVLGVSEKIIIPRFHDPEDVNVTVGEVVSTAMMILAYTQPYILWLSIISPLGTERQYINFALINSTRSEQYNLILTVDIINIEYLGQYCVDVQNKDGNLTLCSNLKDPDCCPPTENSMSSSDDVTLVDVGERIILQREITGYPRPSINVESMISPVGVNRHKRYINYTLINTTKSHHYNLSLSVFVVTKHYIGKYCIYLVNKHGGLLVCYTLIQVTNDPINIFTGIIIIICLLIAVFMIGLVFVKIYYNEISANTRNILAEHQYEEVAMQQLPTERTNRTLLRHREALITPSTQGSCDYERPVPLIPHRLIGYDQQENINDAASGEEFVSGDDAASGEDVVSGDDGLEDTNSASLFTPQNGDQTFPKYIDTESRSLSYTRLDRQTMNQRPNSYQELNVQDKDNK